MRIAIYGAGGFGKEVSGMLALEGKSIVGFIDDYKKDVSLPDDTSFDDVLIAIADPDTRRKLVENWSWTKVPFNNFISRDILLHPSVQIGRGSIICPGVKITVDVSIGDFVIVNLNSTIGHDVTIGNFSSLMPSVNISGNVTLGERVFVGTGATILQGLTIGDDVVIGAGSMVTHDVASGNIVMGVPAKIK